MATNVIHPCRPPLLKLWGGRGGGGGGGGGGGESSLSFHDRGADGRQQFQPADRYSIPFRLISGLIVPPCQQRPYPV